MKPDEMSDGMDEVLTPEQRKIQESRERLSQRADMVARELNDNRSIIHKILGKGTLTGMDIMHYSAQHEFRDQIDRLFDGVMTMRMWLDLSRSEFESMIVRAAEEFRREKPEITYEKVDQYYKDRAIGFARWLEETKYRAFFIGSVDDVETIIRHIRSVAV